MTDQSNPWGTTEAADSAAQSADAWGSTPAPADGGGAADWLNSAPAPAPEHFNIMDPFHKTLIPLDSWVTEGIDWVVTHFRPVFQGIRVPIDFVLTTFEQGLTAIPAPIAILIFALLALAAFVVPMFASEYMLSGILIPFLVLSLAALGLNILTGYAGLLSLGSAAFMAVGAFATGVGATDMGAAFMSGINWFAITHHDVAKRVGDEDGGGEVVECAAPGRFVRSGRDDRPTLGWLNRHSADNHALHAVPILSKCGMGSLQSLHHVEACLCAAVPCRNEQ